MKIALAGEGAIARRHAVAIGNIDGVEIASIAGGNEVDTRAFAAEQGIPHWTLDLDEALARPEVEASVLATPTPLHAVQAIKSLDAGMHTLVEIPMADNLADSEALVAKQAETGLTAMVCHTRRFNPSHHWIREQIDGGALKLQHLVVETFFFRRENRNALGQPRSWTDHLLWHHACHTVDLFQYQTARPIVDVWAQQGPRHPELGIAMDMTVGLRTDEEVLCSLALSFNNEGPFGTWFRYICDNGTYIARYDELVDGNDNPVDLSGVEGPPDGIERQDREFFDAITTGREPNASVAQAIEAMRVVDRLEKSLD
ncbi:MAG TPA: Gfo/Idh/MocA family oxidoreductase [Acidimicrobiia bacterium]|nr:Gfo/Idh/MocA family oxidoreductase [Acidimicrobiia bacterium]